MLTIVEEPKTAAAAAPLGNYYFSPLRLRPVYEATYRTDEHPKSRSVKESKFDFSLELVPKQGQNNRDKFVDEIDDAEIIEDEEGEDIGSESESTASKQKKEKQRKNKKHRKDKPKNSKLRAKLDSTWKEQLCPKLPVSFVLSILGGIVFIACCCALYLRRRIVACFKKCWPFRKKKKNNPQNKNLFNVEEGDNPYQSSVFKKSNKKKKGPIKTIDTGTQDSRTSMARRQEEKPKKVGCSPCCRKKSKKKKLRT